MNTLEALTSAVEDLRSQVTGLQAKLDTIDDDFPEPEFPIVADIKTIPDAFPIGGIIMWSGSVASIPAGWALCDGASGTGTPDLSGRFVVGYKDLDAEYGTVGATGGFKWHGLTENNHSDHDLDLSHVHNLEGVLSTGALADGGSGCFDPTTGNYASPCGNQNTAWCDTDLNADGQIAIAHDGPYNTNQDTDNRPPYYVICFIMRVA